MLVVTHIVGDGFRELWGPYAGWAQAVSIVLKQLVYYFKYWRCRECTRGATMYEEPTTVYLVFTIQDPHTTTVKLYSLYVTHVLIAMQTIKHLC